MGESKTYNEAFKRKVVTEVLSGRLTKEQARLRYGIGGNNTILDWMRKYAGFKMRTAGCDPLPILRNMSTDESKEELKDKIKQLEAKLEYAELKGRAYQIMVEIAKEQYNLDLEKKSGAKQSNNSKKNTPK
jgi:transposase-like protein